MATKFDKAMLDRWIVVALQERHDAVLREQIPEALLALFRADSDEPVR